MSTQSTSQALLLKLNSHQAHVIDQFQKLYSDELMVDCTLSCNDGSIKAHKLVLSACSPYFTSLFTNFTNPYQYPVIILKDMSYADLKVLIEFMYKGEVTVSQNLLPSILESAKALQITGLREVKIASQETKPIESTSKPNKRRKRKHKSETGESTDGGSDLSTDNELNDSKQTDNQILDVLNEDVNTTGDFINEQTDELIEVDQEISNVSHESSSPTKHQSQHSHLHKSARHSTAHSTTLNTSQSPQQNKMLHSSTSTAATSNNSTAQSSLVPTTYKQNLRQLRIEKTAATTGNFSGRKMWSEEETKCLVKIWEEESARVWASAGKKVLSLQRISDLLMQENIDRDVSQVEGKIKALKRDFKQIKQDRAIHAVQQRMAPYLDKLQTIFSRETE